MHLSSYIPFFFSNSLHCACQASTVLQSYTPVHIFLFSCCILDFNFFLSKILYYALNIWNSVYQRLYFLPAISNSYAEVPFTEKVYLIISSDETWYENFS